MDKKSSAHSRAQLKPDALSLLNDSKLPNELKETLKENLEISYFNYLQIVSHLNVDFSYVYLEVVKEKISRIENIFYRFKIGIEKAFRFNCLNFIIGKTRLDKPLYSLVVEYVRKAVEEKGWKLHEAYVNESFSVSYRLI